MIVDSFLNVSSIAGFIYVFDQSLGGWAVVSILFALVVVLSGAFRSFGGFDGDWISSIMNALYIVTVFALFLFLTKFDGVRLLNLGKLSIFLALCGLSILYKKMTES